MENDTGMIVMASRKRFKRNTVGIEQNKICWYYSDDLLKEGEILQIFNIKLLVLETPIKKWYKQLLQSISWGLYKAPIGYKCKIL